MKQTLISDEAQQELDEFLFDAILQNDLDDAAHWLEEGARINVRHGDVGKSQTCLEVAMENERFSIAQWLLENGADINLKNESGITPWQNILTAGHPLPLKKGWLGLALKHGADVETTLGNNHQAAFAEKLDEEAFTTVGMLVAGGVDLYRTSWITPKQIRGVAEYNRKTISKGGPHFITAKLNPPGIYVVDDNPTSAKAIVDFADEVEQHLARLNLVVEDLQRIHRGEQPLHAEEIATLAKSLSLPTSEVVNPYELFEADGSASLTLKQLCGARLVPELFREGAWKDGDAAMMLAANIRSAITPYHQALPENQIDLSTLLRETGTDIGTAPVGTKWQRRVAASASTERQVE